MRTLTVAVMLAGGMLVSMKAVASAYDPSWMDAYTWTDRSNRLQDSAFVMNTSESRPLRFTGTDYITLPKDGNSAPLVLNGQIFLQTGDKLSKKRTAIIGGTTHAIDYLWAGNDGQIIDVANATVDGESGVALRTASGGSGWSINLYDGAVWLLPVLIQNVNANVLNPVVNVYGGTFAPVSFTRSQETAANCVKKLDVNFFDGAVFDGLCTVGSCAYFNVQPNAQVTLQTAAVLREISPAFTLGAGSVTRVVKRDNSGPDNNRYKLTNDKVGVVGPGDILITSGAELDLRISNLSNYTGTITVEAGGKFQFPTYFGILSSTDAKVVFKGGIVGETAYGTIDNKLMHYRGRIEIESWEEGVGFAFGDSPATVTLKSGCAFAHNDLADLALLTGGTAGGRLIAESNSTVSVSLPLVAGELPPFFGERTTFPAEGKMKLVVAIAKPRDLVFTLGSGYGPEVVDAIELTMAGDAGEDVVGSVRVVDGILQLVVESNGTATSVLGATRRDEGVTKVVWSIDAFGRNSSRAAVTFEWSDDPDFATVLGTKALGEFDELGEQSFAFPELPVPGRHYVRFTTVNDAGTTKVGKVSTVGFARWRPKTAADTWASASWDVGKATSETFSDRLSVVFDGGESAFPTQIALPNPVVAFDVDVTGERSYVIDNAGNLSMRTLLKDGSGSLTLKRGAAGEILLPQSATFNGGEVVVAGANISQGLELGSDARLSVSNATVKAQGSGALRIGTECTNGVVELWQGVNWELPIYCDNLTEAVNDAKIHVHSGAVLSPSSWGSRDGSTASRQVRKVTVELEGGECRVRSNIGSCVTIAAKPCTTSTLQSSGSVNSVFGEVSVPSEATVKMMKFNDGGTMANRVKLENAHLRGTGKFVVTEGVALDLRPVFAEEFAGVVDVEEGGGFYFPSSQGVSANSNMVVNVKGGGLGSSIYGTSNNLLHYYPGTLNIHNYNCGTIVDLQFQFGDSPTTVNVVEGGSLVYTNLVDLALFTGGESTGTLNLARNSTLEVAMDGLPGELPQFLGSRTTFPQTGMATLRVRLGETVALWKAYTLGTGYSASVLSHARAICVDSDNTEWYGSLRVKGNQLVLIPHGGLMIYVR